MDRVASSRPARPGPGGHVRLRLGRVGGERAELGVSRCGSKRTSRAFLPTPAQPTGSPLDAESRRSLPRGAIPARVPPKVPLPPLWTRPGGEAGVQTVFQPCFPTLFSSVPSLGGAGPSPWVPRQKADSESLPLLPGVWKGRRGASPSHLSDYFLRAVTWHTPLRPEKPNSGPSLFIRKGSSRPSLPDVKPKHLDSRHTLTCYLPGALHPSH